MNHVLSDENITALASLLRSADKIACLSGAGMSTESGIPDFRSPQGLYRQLSSEEVFDLRAFQADPERFYRQVGPLYTAIEEAKPNSGHLALAALVTEKQKQVKIATQNIDGLHQKAGTEDVYEVHGTMRTLTCQKCGEQVTSSNFKELLDQGIVLKHHCQGVLKPDITFFGEMLPAQAFVDAQRAMAEADLVLVLGTSLRVYPAAGLPQARRQDCPLVIINREATAMDEEAELVIQAAIGQVLPAAVVAMAN